MNIIHIVENLDRGAVENWLVNIFLESRKTKPEWKWTFYCILGREGKLDKRVREAGGEIIYSPVTLSNKLAFLSALRKVLKNGKFDIIHSHHDFLSGFYLLASSGIKFRKRILHVHNTDRALPVGNRFLHNALLNPFRRLGFFFSDIVVGISNDTLRQFVSDASMNGLDYRVLYYGIEMSAYERAVDPAQFRQLNALPSNSKIMLFVGRMNEHKNPVFLVDILADILKHRNDVYAVFVGRGDLQSRIRERAEELKVTEYIRIIDWSDDIASIMKSADVFVFPRVEFPKEGLGLVVVEAQSAGLPLVISNGIVPDAIIINELCRVKRLNLPVHSWAKSVLDSIDETPQVSKTEALERMKRSHFNLELAARNLVELYEC